MLSVVHLSDCSKGEFIQPHLHFVCGEECGCIERSEVFFITVIR